MGCRWPYSWCFVGCCLQNLFNIARSILIYIYLSALSLSRADSTESLDSLSPSIPIIHCTCIRCPHRGNVYKYFTGGPTVVYPCRRVNRIMSLMSSFLFLWQCSACLVHLIWIFWKMGGTDTVTVWKKSFFISSKWSDFHMIENLFSCSSCSTLVYVNIAFSRWDITAEVCELMSIYFIGLTLKVQMGPSCLKHMKSVLSEFT